MNKRLDYIDKAKGILIILMVIGHIWQKGYMHNVIYSFHMPAFFAISGMLLSHTKSYEKDFRQFLAGRVYAFGIPFLFIELLGVLTEILRHGVTLNIKGYLANTLMWNFNDPNLWFLVNLFLMEMIFAIAKKTLKKDAAVWAVCGVLLALSMVLPRGNSYMNVIVSTFRNFLFFTTGFYGTRLFVKKNIFAFAGSLAAIFAVATVFGKRIDGSLSVANTGFLIAGFCGTYVAVQLGLLSFAQIGDRFLTSAGRNTIIIYGTHRLYYSIVGILLGITDYGTTPVWAGLTMLAAVALLEIPTIYIINRWLPFLAGKRYKKAKTVAAA